MGQKLWWPKQKPEKRGNWMGAHWLARGSQVGFERNNFKAIEYELLKRKVEQLGKEKPTPSEGANERVSFLSSIDWTKPYYIFLGLIQDRV